MQPNTQKGGREGEREGGKGEKRRERKNLMNQFFLSTEVMSNVCKDEHIE